MMLGGEHRLGTRGRHDRREVPEGPGGGFLSVSCRGRTKWLSLADRFLPADAAIIHKVEPDGFVHAGPAPRGFSGLHRGHLT